MDIRRASDGAALATTSQIISADVHDFFSTGSVLNNGAFLAEVASVLISNDDGVANATVELEVFEVTLNDTGFTKVGAVHQMFTVPPHCRDSFCKCNWFGI